VLVVFTQCLKIGIPNGSLIDQNRGGLKELLDGARIDVKNLGENSPLEITNIPWLSPVVGRPQELPALAADGYVDVFFCGDDWAREWECRGKRNERLLGLGIGKVDIVFAGKKETIKPPYRVASEYPYLAREALQSFLNILPKIVELGEEIPELSEYVIIPSVGATEAKNYYDICDFIIEATQSGDTLEEYGLRVMRKVMESECSLYCNEETLSDPWKMKKASRLKTMLEGVIYAKGKDLITFNIPNERLESVLTYIQENQLFGDEETVIKGRTMSEITLEVSSKDGKLPLIDIIGDLKDLGASCIEGIPISYSIR